MVAVSLDDLIDVPEEEKEAAKRVIKEIEVSGRKVGAPATLLATLDDYGMIRFALKTGGPVPLLLQGSFTSLAAADAAIQIWQSQSPKESVAVEEPVKVSKDSISFTDISTED